MGSFMQNPEARDDQSKHAVPGITNGYPFIKEQGARKGPLVACEIRPVLLTRAVVRFELVEALQATHRIGIWCSEIIDENEILQIVGKPVRLIRETAKIRAAFQRIADFQPAVVLATH